MSEEANKFVSKRAETLAREFLTRRPEVDLHPFEGNDLDLVATISPSTSLRVQGFQRITEWYTPPGNRSPLRLRPSRTHFCGWYSFRISSFSLSRSR